MFAAACTQINATDAAAESRKLLSTCLIKWGRARFNQNVLATGSRHAGCVRPIV
jgi:hypothetical protein